MMVILLFLLIGMIFSDILEGLIQRYSFTLWYLQKTKVLDVLAGFKFLLDHTSLAYINRYSFVIGKGKLFGCFGQF